MYLIDRLEMTHRGIAAREKQLEEVKKAKEELEAKQKEVKKKLERIAVLQARTNNVLNGRVSGGLTRPAAIMSEGEEVGTRRGRET